MIKHPWNAPKSSPPLPSLRKSHKIRIFNAHSNCYKPRYGTPFYMFHGVTGSRVSGLQGTRIVKMRRRILRRWEEIGRKSGTGMRFVELNGRREGPIDHGECKD